VASVHICRSVCTDPVREVNTNLDLRDQSVSLG
jgi:hypothetical protein